LKVPISTSSTCTVEVPSGRSSEQKPMTTSCAISEDHISDPPDTVPFGPVVEMIQ
jgi:hypothetical protein